MGDPSAPKGEAFSSVERELIDAVKVRIRAIEKSGLATDALIASFGDDDAALGRSYRRCLRMAREELDADKFDPIDTEGVHHGD